MEEHIGNRVLLAALENTFLAIFFVEHTVLGSDTSACRVEHDIYLLN